MVVSPVRRAAGSVLAAQSAQAHGDQPPAAAVDHRRARADRDGGR
jgi:hypothetical protein